MREHGDKTNGGAREQEHETRYQKRCIKASRAIGSCSVKARGESGVRAKSGQQPLERAPDTMRCAQGVSPSTVDQDRKNLRNIAKTKRNSVLQKKEKKQHTHIQPPQRPRMYAPCTSIPKTSKHLPSETQKTLITSLPRRKEMKKTKKRADAREKQQQQHHQQQQQQQQYKTLEQRTRREKKNNM